MRRTVFNAALVATAALILNLAVAWSCATWSPFHHWTPLPNHEGPGYPETWSGGPFGEDGWWQTRWGFGFTQYASLIARGAEGDFTYWKSELVPYREAGWPMRSFRASVQAYYDPETYERPRRWDLPFGVIIKRGIPTDDLPVFLRATAERRLPIVPIWVGLLINSLLYCILIVTTAKLGKILTSKCKVFARGRAKL